MFLKRDVVLVQEYLGFLLLNIFDLFLTGYIFRHGGKEGNALALWVLNTYGLGGFAIYKFLLVVVVVLAVEGVAMKHLRKARILMTGACVLLLAVVLWECFLIFSVVNAPPPIHAPGGPSGSAPISGAP